MGAARAHRNGAQCLPRHLSRVGVAAGARHLAASASSMPPTLIGREARRLSVATMSGISAGSARVSSTPQTMCVCCAEGTLR